MWVSNADIMADRALVVDEASIIATNSFAAYTLRSTLGRTGERMAHGPKRTHRWGENRE